MNDKTRPPVPDMPVFELTPEQKALVALQRILDTRHEAVMKHFAEAMGEITALRPKCTNHVWVLPDNAKYEWWGEWVIEAYMKCAICSREVGWYCPTSPSLHCEYESGDYDQCDYCGQPDERK